MTQANLPPGNLERFIARKLDPDATSSPLCHRQPVRLMTKITMRTSKTVWLNPHWIISIDRFPARGESWTRIRVYGGDAVWVYETDEESEPLIDRIRPEV